MTDATMPKPESRASTAIIFFFFVLLALGGFSGLPAQEVPTPESVLGYKPGADFRLTKYSESLAYFQKLAASSDRIRLQNVGKTSEGREWYIAIISSAENLKNVERHREIARRVAQVRGLTDEAARALAKEGRVIVHIDGGLHSTEVAGQEHTIQLAYDLVTGTGNPEIRNILDEVILVLWFAKNPDGQEMVADWYRRNLGTPFEISPMPWLYQKYIGHDNNRDGYMNSLPESKVVTRVTAHEWFPQVYFNHHQTAPFPARIWIPPFAEPISSNVHPLIWRWTNVFGSAMAAYLDRKDMPGSIHRTHFDNWYPGFIDAVNNYRNTISFLTETALYRYATPHFYTLQDFPREYQDLRQQVFYSSPWKGGWWRLGDAVAYMIGASMSVLDTAAKYREEIIYTRYQAGRDVMQRFTKEPPFAYVIPQRQRDPQTAALLLEKLQFNGLEISQASQAISANGREYPAGTWVILMDQPYSLLAKELFETQNYPDLRDTPGGDPDLPYDVAGWTLPLQMGVDVAAVTVPLGPEVRSRIRRIDQVTPPEAGVSGSGSTFVFDHAANVSFKAVNRILKAGGTVSVTRKPTSAGGSQLEAGAFVASGIPESQMQAIAGDLSLKVHAVRSLGEPQTPIKAPRIGLYSSWVASIDEGWTRWLLEQFEFPVLDVRNDDVRAGQLRDRYDVLVFAEMGPTTILDGHRSGTIPAEYANGIGAEGLENVKQFVQGGGTLVAIGNASTFAIEQLNLPVRNVLKGLKNLEFFCSGSILRTVGKEGGHFLLNGLPAEPAVFFARNGAFEVERDFKGTVLLSYRKDQNPLLSGFILGPEKIQTRAAALDVQYGRGRVILSGFRPQWRGQTHQMFKFLFNALFYFGEAAAAEPAAGPPKGGLEGEWSKLMERVRPDLEKAFGQNEKFAAARGSQAVEEGRKYDAMVQQFQGAHFPAMDELKQKTGSRQAAGKIDEYKSQLKAALVDMRGKDYSSVKFGLADLKRQFRLGALEQEIGELLKSP